MNILPITPTYPACFGISCYLHPRCARYALVESSEADPNTIATCLEGEGFPLFVEREEGASEKAWCQKCGCGNDVLGFAHLPLCVEREEVLAS